MKMIVSLEMPPALAEPRQPLPPPVSVEEKVRDAMECIESGHPSQVEWLMVNKLYAALKAKKNPSPRMQSLIQMIEPTLAKYGYHKIASNNKQ